MNDNLPAFTAVSGSQSLENDTNIYANPKTLKISFALEKGDTPRLIFSAVYFVVGIEICSNAYLLFA